MSFPKSILKGIWQIQKRSHSLQVFLSKCYYYLNRNNRRIHGKRNVLKIEGAYLKKVEINIAGDDNYISIGANSRVSNVKIEMKGSGHCLEIGESCILAAGSFWFQTRDCRIIVGNQTTFEEANVSALEPKAKVQIGEDCMFSYDVHIRNGDSHSILDLESNQRINLGRDIYIGDHVWLGAHVNVLKGVTIGENSVIGIRSLVTSDIPSHCVAAGLPAKVKRSNTYWTRELIEEEERPVSS